MRFRRRYKWLVAWGACATILLAGAGYVAIKYRAITYTPTATNRSEVKTDTKNVSVLTKNLAPTATTWAQTIQPHDSITTIAGNHSNKSASGKTISTRSKTHTTLTQAHPQTPSPPLAPLPTTKVFFDDFESNTLNTSKWRIGKRQWAGLGVNGGVVPRNVSVADGNLILESHGDLYDGPVMGINKFGVPRTHGKLAGGGAATKRYFASGRYEVRAKITPELGVCSSFATMHYRELYPGQLGYKEAGGNGRNVYIVNHEIDIELPGRPRVSAIYDVSYEYCLANTWRGQKRSEVSDYYIHIGQPQNDGQYHTYRFDWHTGDDGAGQAPRVDFYIDDRLIQTTTANIPTHGSRFWVSAWFPNKWAGVPSFIQSRMYVDWVRITPFNQPNDQWVPESYANDGWAADDEYPPHTLDGQMTDTPILQNTLMIADFDTQDKENLLGGKFNSFSAYPSNANVGVTDQEFHGNAGRSLQINYVKKIGRPNFCGTWVRFAPDTECLDTTGYRYLTFYVKGKQGREDFNIGLADRAWSEEKDDAKLVGNIRDFLPNGVTRQWRKVKVPLAQVLRLNFRQMSQFALIFRVGRGEIYIDDVQLEG